MDTPLTTPCSCSSGALLNLVSVARFSTITGRPEASVKPACEFAAGRLMRGADQPLLPADAGAQQQLGVARHEFEDLHELDVEDGGDRR